VDAAVCASTVDQARSILAAVVQQRLTTAERLRPYVLSRPTLPRHAILLETIADVEGGAQSLPELAWTRGIRRAGLPEPDRQRVVRRTDGRYFLDADFDEWETTVEINGAQHVDPVVRDYDDERRFELSAGGRLVIDIASHLVRHDLPRAVLRTARGLHCRGWQPSQPVAERLHRMADARGSRSGCRRCSGGRLDHRVPGRRGGAARHSMQRSHAARGSASRTSAPVTQWSAFSSWSLVASWLGIGSCRR